MAEKEKNNDTKVIKVKRTAFSISQLNNNFERFVNNTISLVLQKPYIARIKLFRN
jgi:hypothetical protein